MFFWHLKKTTDDVVSDDWLEDKLTLVQWNIARYDQIRSSTGSRASLLVSANALLLTGATILFSNYNNIERPTGCWQSFVTTAFIVALGATLVFTLLSVWFCVGAISAYKTRKTSRRIFRDKMPSRFIFNWGDTLRLGAGYENFWTKMQGLTRSDALNAASAELWSAIYQHSKRHGHLRKGIRLFRISLAAFFLLASMAVIHRFG
jgi:hypothetical protein